MAPSFSPDGQALLKPERRSSHLPISAERQSIHPSQPTNRTVPTSAALHIRLARLTRSPCCSGARLDPPPPRRSDSRSRCTHALRICSQTDLFSPQGGTIPRTSPRSRPHRGRGQPLTTVVDRSGRPSDGGSSGDSRSAGHRACVGASHHVPVRLAAWGTNRNR